MNKTKQDDIFKKLKGLMIDIILCLRPEKTINRIAFDELYDMLDCLKVEIQDSEKIPQKFTALLLLTNYLILSEAKHAKYPEDIMKEIFILEKKMIDLFDENLMKGNDHFIV
jgi:hypothetical protein